MKQSMLFTIALYGIATLVPSCLEIYDLFLTFHEISNKYHDLSDLVTAIILLFGKFSLEAQFFSFFHEIYFIHFVKLLLVESFKKFLKVIQEIFIQTFDIDVFRRENFNVFWIAFSQMTEKFLNSERLALSH